MILPKTITSVVALVLFFSASANATARPDTTRMSCDRAAALVGRVGGIVLSTGPHTYDRFVTSSAFCNATEVTKPAFVPTGDNPQCFIGYTCEEFERDFPEPN